MSYFGSKDYPGEYRGVYGTLYINIDTGEIDDRLDREAIDNYVRLNCLPIDQNHGKQALYVHIQDEVFGIDEDACVGRGLSFTETGVDIDINHWMQPNQDATITIDDSGTHVRVHEANSEARRS